MRRLAAAACLLAAAAAAGADDARLERMRGEIARLRGELASLVRTESGLLGDVARLDAEVRLREAEAAEAGLRLAQTQAALAERDAGLAGLERAQEARRRYLAFRMREMYKAGPGGVLAAVLGGAQERDALAGVRYAAYLGERDAHLLRAFREDRARLSDERRVLGAERERFEAVGREAAVAASRLEARRAERASLLQRIREDRRQHQSALGELEGASRDLSRIVRDAGQDAPAPRLDVRKFRGLLDWPSDGRVAIPFGTSVHPRFKTRIPHPGIDLDAPRGADVRAIFDGRVVYASGLPGYGLTAIVDHGNGVASVYTHAAVLVVSVGQEVGRGDVVGKVGESGPLGGTGLYFEIREAGRPVDPVRWLRRR